MEETNKLYIIELDEKCIQEEVKWAVIKEFPNYRISNTGIVKNFKTGNIIKQREHGEYYTVTLHDRPNNLKNNYLVHRLISEYFIENPDPINFKIVDHIDRNKLNNIIPNLRWCNASTNSKNRNLEKNRSNKVIQYDLDGNLIKIWDSANCISKDLNFNISTLRSCCNGNVHNHTFKGSIWKYVNHDEKQKNKLTIDLNDYLCIGIINGDDFSNYYISKDGSKIINKKLGFFVKFTVTVYNYKRVGLRASNKHRSLYVHKIINQVINGGKYDDIIDHINGKKDDNSVDNLEVVTQKENIVRACGKSVRQIDIKTGETIKIFRSLSEANLEMDKKLHNNDISRVCNGKANSAYGYKWTWA